MNRRRENPAPHSKELEIGAATSGEALIGLNENHKNCLRLTFEHVDKLLSDALHELNSPDPASPFQRCVPDALPIQRKVVADYFARLRRMMEGVLDRHDVARRKPSVSSVWAFRTALMYAKIAVEELAPKYMRGYGELPAEAAHDLEVLTTELCGLLEQIDNYLAAGAGRGLQDRLRKLEQTSHESEWLRLLEEVITAQGLVNLRPALDTLVERMESGNLEVAVFGRVSSGKSSLLNHILQTNVLPVGVTPVTAVPTRVGYGPHAQARITFAQGHPIVVDPADLPSYATEQGNPDNAKHVARIQVALPIERLKGVTFVDTPGLGSVSRCGELESLAYLPRCDIGIMLVDASSTLTLEDVAVIQALYLAGADVMVLLNKTDMLAAEERATAMQYVVDRLRTDLGQDVPVFLVSIKGGDTVLCDEWFEKVLVPRLNERLQLVRISLRRKIGLLRDAAVSALQRRLSQKDTTGAEQLVAIAQSLREGLAAVEKAARDGLDIKGAALAERVLDATTQAMLAAWHEGGSPEPDAGAMVLATAHDQASQLAVGIAATIEDLRTSLLMILQSAHVDLGREPNDAVDLPPASEMPVLQLSPLPDLPLRVSMVDSWLGGRGLRRRLGSRLTALLIQSFDRYVVELRRWQSDTFAEIRRAYSALMDLYLAESEQGEEGTDRVSTERAIERLQTFDAVPTTPASDRAVVEDGNGWASTSSATTPSACTRPSAT